MPISVRPGAVALLAACLVALSGVGTASAVEPFPFLDPSFGGTGLVKTDFSGGEDGANAVAVGPDGTVVAAGFADLADPDRPHVPGFGLARYLSNGSLDPGFSGDGRFNVDFGLVNQAAGAVAVDSAGRTVATGTITTFDGSTSSIGVSRQLPNGLPDPGFGTDGRVTIQPGVLSAAYDVAIDSSDRILVMGAATGPKGFRPMVLRFAADGTLDGSFGDGGALVFGRVAKDLYGSIAIDRRGRSLLAGTSRPPGTSHGVPAVRRMSPSGVLDRSYGRNGIALPLGRMEGDAAAVAIDGSGHTSIAATCACGPKGDDDFAVGRVTARGRVDASFRGDGRSFVRFGAKDARPSSIAIDPSGRIVVAGSVRVAGHTDWALARLKANGRPDGSFGSDGVIAAALGAGVEGVQGIAIDDESRVIAVGLGTGSVGSDFAVARFR